MDPNLLLRDELEFELACRGIYDVKTCAPMRKILKEILSQEISGSTSIQLKAPRTAVENPLAEINTCLIKCRALAVALEEIKHNPDRVSLKRITTRLEHVNNRITLILPTESDHIEQHAAARTEIQKLVTTVNSLQNVDEFEGQDELTDYEKDILHKSLGDEASRIIQNIEEKASSAMEVTVDPIPTNTQTADVKYNGGLQDDRSVINSRRQVFSRTSTLDLESSKRKLVPVKDWGIKFSGRGNISINAFLERINELKAARNAEDVDLYRYAIDLFEEDALIWFRANRDNVSNWRELVDLLLLTFQKPFYQEELLEEIRARTQGRQESVLIYIAIMQNMFNRLPTKLMERQKLSILLKNVQPYFQLAVCRENFNSVAELTTVLRVLEHTRIHCENFREPTHQARSLEPDLAFQGTSSQFVNAIDDTNYTHQHRESSNQKCWNCRNIGHRFRDCNLPQQRMFCYKCGRFGITTNSCSCNNNNIHYNQGNGRTEDGPANRLP